MPQNIGTCVSAAAVGALVVCQIAVGQATEIGVHDLEKRLGPLAPTGMGVVIGQVEAPESPGNYGPNQGHADFVGKTFLPQSGPAGNSGHATLVGRLAYGNDIGMAPGVSTIYLYEAGAWLQAGFLRLTQTGTPPQLPPGGLKIFNNSWIASISPALDNEALRRADFSVTRDQTIMVNGVNNQGGPQVPLLSHSYNSISVGLSNGQHVSGQTLAGIDGPGRQKPEIVAPGQFTSFVVPLVDGVAARLVEAARTSTLGANQNAERSETIKAVLLAGANHRSGWSNNPSTSGATRGITSTPLDPVYGADVVNANNSHLILTGEQQAGANSPPTAVNVIRRGWDLATVSAGASKYYRFRVGALADQVSIVATWNRFVASNFGSWNSPNFNLMLKRVDGNGNLVDLTGNAGLPYFASGNVVSQSSVDNVEHLFIRNLQPGEYAIQLQRTDALGGSRDVAIAWLLPKKPGDVNEDGSVGVPDLLAVINSWGACPAPCIPYCPADLSEDCVVGVADLLMVINNWG